MVLRLALLPTALAAVALLAGCSGGSTPASTPTSSTVHGSITLGSTATSGDSDYRDDSTGTYTQGTDCTGTSGYDDIAEGAEVDVVDGAGKVLAIGKLDAGSIASDGYSCVFDFTVADVPPVEGVYGVKIGNTARGVVHYTKAQLLAGPALTLGD